MFDANTLLEEVKVHLNITWNDSVTNDSILKTIEEANYYLVDKSGKEIDYSVDLHAKALLKDYCRYVRNYSFEYFETNFLNQIWSLIFRYADKEEG